jgi:hypothetical protein
MDHAERVNPLLASVMDRNRFDATVRNVPLLDRPRNELRHWTLAALPSMPETRDRPETVGNVVTRRQVEAQEAAAQAAAFARETKRFAAILSGAAPQVAGMSTGLQFRIANGILPGISSSSAQVYQSILAGDAESRVPIPAGLRYLNAQRASVHLCSMKRV